VTSPSSEEQVLDLRKGLRRLLAFFSRGSRGANFGIERLVLEEELLV